MERVTLAGQLGEGDKVREGAGEGPGGKVLQPSLLAIPRTYMKSTASTELPCNPHTHACPSSKQASKQLVILNYKIESKTRKLQERKALSWSVVYQVIRADLTKLPCVTSLPVSPRPYSWTHGNIYTYFERQQGPQV